jgi:hypothetical protein
LEPTEEQLKAIADARITGSSNAMWALVRDQVLEAAAQECDRLGRALKEGRRRTAEMRIQISNTVSLLVTAAAPGEGVAFLSIVGAGPHAFVDVGTALNEQQATQLCDSLRRLVVAGGQPPAPSENR